LPLAGEFGLGGDDRLLAASAVGIGDSVPWGIRLAEMSIARRATPTPAS
jgi:hypothetical protein